MYNFPENFGLIFLISCGYDDKIPPRIWEVYAYKCFLFASLCNNLLWLIYENFWVICTPQKYTELEAKSASASTESENSVYLH